MVDKALKLIKERIGDDGNQRTYLELEDGRKYPLPYFWREEEFTLPGNHTMIDGGDFLALYDESTRTGAYFCRAAVTPHWVLWQPCTRELFFDDLVPAGIEYAKAMKAQRAENDG